MKKGGGVTSLPKKFELPKKEKKTRFYLSSLFQPYNPQILHLKTEMFYYEILHGTLVGGRSRDFGLVTVTNVTVTIPTFF